MRRNVRRRIAQERIYRAIRPGISDGDADDKRRLEPETIFLRLISDPPTLGRGPEIKAFDSAKPKQ
jgi:hypothetical protein